MAAELASSRMSKLARVFSENIVSNMKQSRGKRKYRRNAVFSCSKCGAKHTRTGQRYCVECHCAYMREWRKTHPLNDEQKKKDICRSYANVYKKRGKLVQVPCEKCGSPKSQMHHHDYSKPLEVEWLCRPCHMTLHRQEEFEKRQNVLAGMIAGTVEKSKRAA